MTPSKHNNSGEHLCPASGHAQFGMLDKGNLSMLEFHSQRCLVGDCGNFVGDYGS